MTNQTDSKTKPITVVIFGASGDLTRRKLVPAVYSLFSKRLLPERFTIVGLARTEKSNDAFREHLREGVALHARAGAPDGAGLQHRLKRLQLIYVDLLKLAQPLRRVEAFQFISKLLQVSVVFNL